MLVDLHIMNLKLKHGGFKGEAEIYQNNIRKLLILLLELNIPISYSEESHIGFVVENVIIYSKTIDITIYCNYDIIDGYNVYPGRIFKYQPCIERSISLNKIKEILCPLTKN